MNEIDGKKLCYFRKKAGLSQEVLGEKLKITKAMVSFWETERNPVDPKYHDEICKILKIDIADISKKIRFSGYFLDCVKELEHWTNLYNKKPNFFEAKTNEEAFYVWMNKRIEELGNIIYENSSSLCIPIADEIKVNAFLVASMKKTINHFAKGDLSLFSQKTLISEETINELLAEGTIIYDFSWERVFKYIYNFLDENVYYSHYEIRKMFSSFDEWENLSQCAYYNMPPFLIDRFIQRENEFKKGIFNIYLREDAAQKTYGEHKPFPAVAVSEVKHEVRPLAPGELKRIPIIGIAQASGYDYTLEQFDQYATENALGYAPIVGKTDGLLAIKIEGDSMSPWYPDGTVVIISCRQTPAHGKRVVAKLRDSGEVVFKVFLRKDKKVKLASINEEAGKGFEWDNPEDNPFWWIYPVKYSFRDEDDIDFQMQINGIHNSWEKEEGKTE